MTITLAAALAAFACGGGAVEPEVPTAVPEVEPAEPERPRGVLYRDEVLETVDAGLGYFLQRVELEPSLSSGRFRGFRVVTLRPPGFWDGVDLEPGDVVTSINGMPIERETEAFAAFESLRKAPSLRVSILRGGEPRELVFKIVDRDGSAPPTSPAEGPSKAPPKPRQNG